MQHWIRCQKINVDYKARFRYLDDHRSRRIERLGLAATEGVKILAKSAGLSILD
jgi:hypothetical protein